MIHLPHGVLGKLNLVYAYRIRKKRYHQCVVSRTNRRESRSSFSERTRESVCAVSVSHVRKTQIVHSMYFCSYTDKFYRYIKLRTIHRFRYIYVSRSYLVFMQQSQIVQLVRCDATGEYIEHRTPNSHSKQHTISGNRNDRNFKNSLNSLSAFSLLQH